MKRKLLNCLAAIALSATAGAATPAMAFHGGGMGGMHGGFGGMHSGSGGGFHGGMAGGRNFAVNRFAINNRNVVVNRFAANRFAFNHRFAFRHHRFFHRAAFFGAPFVAVGGYNSCWRRVWTWHGWRWIDVCDY